MTGYSIYQTEFPSLMENPVEGVPASLNRKLPKIGRAGINILFPQSKIPDFVRLITTELAVKTAFLSPKQPVCYLRLRGFPLKQCSVEEITELLFRLGSRFNIENAGRHCTLTEEGILHFATTCNLYSLHPVLDPAG